VIPCGPTQVAVENGVTAGCFFVASWCCALMVEVIVGAAAVSTLWSFAAGHAYIRGMAELEAVFAH